MGKRTGRKVLSILLAVCMMIGGLGSPVAGYATEGGQGVEAETPGQGAENGQDEVAEGSQSVETQTPEQGVENGQGTQILERGGVEDGQSVETPEESAQDTEEPRYALQPLPEDGIVVGSVHEGLSPGEEDNLQAQAENIPVTYDPRNSNRITAVKNQNPYGTCWTFAAMNCAEASLVSKGAPVGTTDLSELHLAYFFYHSVTDPLGNTAGDKNEALNLNTCTPSGTYLDRGGNNIYTTFALANWVGAADESTMPYTKAGATKTYDATLEPLAYQDAAHMQNAYWISFRDRDDIKAMIMQHGAVAMSYYEDDAYLNSDRNSNIYAYYCPEANKGTNHAVSIVGWDDSYPQSNFKVNQRPNGSGAWLIKNSWGEYSRDQGYFWISYEDQAFQLYNAKAVVFDFEKANNYDYNYQYDGNAGVTYSSVANGGQIANIYQVKGNNRTKTGDAAGYGERLEAVSFALQDTNVNYTIDIYKNPNASDPESGKCVSTQSGSVVYAGYHTVKLDQANQVDLQQGDRFSVVVTLSKTAENATAVSYFLSGSNTINPGNPKEWIQFTDATSPGQSFVKPSGSNRTWIDLGKDEPRFTARIKAFTRTLGGSAGGPAPEVPVPVTGVVLYPDVLSLAQGSRATLTPIIDPYNATDRAVTWSTSNSNVATVSANGEVTGIGPGTATITVRTNDRGKTASCQVTVTPVAVTGVALNKTTLSLTAGASETLTATVSPSYATDRAVTWSTSNSNIATVDSNGAVRGVAPGVATITVRTNDGGKTASCHVTVTAAQVAVTGVTLNKNALALTAGASETLLATVYPSNATNSAVTWSTSNSNIATVGADGKVTGISAGTATITVTTDDGGYQVTCAVTVRAARVAVTGVTLNKTALSLTAGTGETLAATVYPFHATDRTVKWSSDNPGVATVGSNGEVRGVSAGTATITVRANDGWYYQATCRVTVRAARVAVTGVALNKTALSLTAGTGETLTATVSPYNATDRAVTWSSDNSGVATVGSNGEVHGVAPGTATITVRTSDGGKTASCRVTVTAQNVSVSYRTHVQDHGWQGWIQNGGFSGTEGESRRLEGINITVSGNSNLGIRYKTHVQDIGWQNYMENGAMSGTSGQSRRLEAIKIQLTGRDAGYYDVYYQVHAQDYGWMGWAKNGECAGTEGQSKRLEGIRIQVVKKGTGYFPGSQPAFNSTYGYGAIQYRTHVQDHGWMGYVQDGAMSGTSGQSRRLEGINIRLGANMPEGSIAYTTHVQDHGWMGEVWDGAMSGTQGESRRLEGIRIRLTGQVANEYDVYYQVHIQDYGWLGWAANGEDAGSEGMSKRLEGIHIRLVPKGSPPPGSRANAFLR